MFHGFYFSYKHIVVSMREPKFSLIAQKILLQPPHIPVHVLFRKSGPHALHSWSCSAICKRLSAHCCHCGGRPCLQRWEQQSPEEAQAMGRRSRQPLKILTSPSPPLSLSRLLLEECVEIHFFLHLTLTHLRIYCSEEASDARFTFREDPHPLTIVSLWTVSRRVSWRFSCFAFRAMPNLLSQV